MKPITRKEFYLAKAAGTYTGPTPPPVLREDYYLATLAGDYSGYCPAPVTRLEKYMSAAAGLTSYVPQPITRIEMYWYAIAKGTGYVPEPVTREEKFLYAVLKNPPKPEYLDKTAEGSMILLTDSAEAPLTALTLYGHSTQDGTPSPDNPVPILSAGSVMTTGKNVLPPESGAEVHMNIPAGTKCFLVTDGTPSNGGNVLLYDAEGNVYYLAIDAGDTEGIYPNGITYNVDIVRFVNRLVPGVNTAMYIGEKLPYEPYTGGVPGVNPYEGEINVSISDGGTQSQTLTISTPGGLPGIPVSSGGNYTDENGQQWVCDEIDLARGKYVQRVNKKVLTSDLSWKYTKTTNYENNNFQIRNLGNNAAASNSINDAANISMCNFLPYHGLAWEDNEIRLPKIYAYNIEITASFPPDSEINSLQTWENLLDSIGDCYIYYILATPIETDLPAEEISAYKALHTYSPTTTVTNDADAWMKVGYKATS